RPRGHGLVGGSAVVAAAPRHLGGGLAVRLVGPDVAVVGGEDAATVVGVVGDHVLRRRALAVGAASAGEEDRVVGVDGGLVAPHLFVSRRVAVDARAALAVRGARAGLVHVHAAGGRRHVRAVDARVLELRVVDAHLAQHALQDVDVAGGDGEARDVVESVE